MKTYKEFTKLFEATMLRPRWRTEFEKTFRWKNEVAKKNELEKLMKEMKRDVLPKQMVQHVENKLNQWTETSDPEAQKGIESTILNTIFVPKR